MILKVASAFSEIVTVERNFVDLLVWLAVGLGIAVTAVIIGVLIIEVWRTPLESKILRKTSNSKKPALLLAGDDGLVDIEMVGKRGAEGIAETELKGKMKDHYTGFYPRPTTTPLVLVEEANSSTATNGGTPDTTERQNRTQAIAEYISNLNSKPMFLRGAKIALGVAYRGKAVITTIAALAGLKIVDDLLKLYPDDTVNVDVTAIKQYVSNQWNESQIEANEADKFKQGQLEERRSHDTKWWILPVLSVGLVLIGLAALVAVLKFL